MLPYLLTEVFRRQHTDAVVVDWNAQASSRSHPTTPITPPDEEEGSASGGEEAIVALPTQGLEATLAESSGADSNAGQDLAPELFAQVQQAIAPAVVTPRLLTLIRCTEPTALSHAIQAAMNYRKTHSVRNPVGLLITAIRQQWQPQSCDGYAAFGCTTVPEFNAWFNWARSSGLVIASQQLEGTLYVYTADGYCYPYTEFSIAHPLETKQI